MNQIKLAFEDDGEPEAIDPLVLEDILLLWVYASVAALVCILVGLLALMILGVI